jgi:hypothetical protein
METPAQDAPAYHVWQAAGKAFEVRIDLDVIDALLAEIMRGFGAVPKRGAEVGGLLLGSIERGNSTVVRIDDFEPVECGYTRGPSYLFTEEERGIFEEACARWRQDGLRPDSGQSSGPQSYAVGYYRSHTRDGLSMAPEDVELMGQFFPGPSNVVLLVKPFATKASPAGFFFRENGAFQETTPLEFPFRRRELTGEEAPERRPLTDKKPRGARELVRATPEEFLEEAPAPEPELQSYFANPPTPAYAITTPSRSRLGAWMWIPLSFIFLLLGVALGALAELNLGPRGGAGGADYSLSMSTERTGDTLSLRWSGDSPLIRKAERGVLEIHDGDYAKITDLDVTQLHNGNIIFHNRTGSVSFRLTVYLNANLSVSENLAWHQ